MTMQWSQLTSRVFDFFSAQELTDALEDLENDSEVSVQCVQCDQCLLCVAFLSLSFARDPN